MHLKESIVKKMKGKKEGKIRQKREGGYFGIVPIQLISRVQ
jgi:hypothetical protein